MMTIQNALPGMPSSGDAALARELQRRQRPAPWEALPWLAAAAVYWLWPDYLSLASQIVVMVLFALSLDVLLGYAGIVTLGHAAYFGLGAYAVGVFNVRGWVTDPLLGLAVAAAVGAGVGAVMGAILLRTRGLTFLMLSIAVLFMFAEGANKAAWLTGGADGLQGITVPPLLGRFEFDFTGHTGYVYVTVVLFVATVLARCLVHSPFGASLTGLRENSRRMAALGAPVQARLLVVYAMTAALAAVAGGLNTQINQFAALNSLSLDLSGAVLVMLVLGGTGRFYGAFVGAPVYLLAEHVLSAEDPTYWLFWIGVMLVLIALFAPGGLLSLAESVTGRLRKKFMGGRP